MLVDRSGRRYPLDEPRWRGDDGSPLLVEPLPGITREDVDRTVRSQWRYAAALPVAVNVLPVPDHAIQGWLARNQERAAMADGAILVALGAALAVVALF